MRPLVPGSTEPWTGLDCPRPPASRRGRLPLSLEPQILPMRNLAALALAGLSLLALAPAQSLPLAQTPGNNGNVGGGLYFDLTVTQITTINSIDYYCRNDGAAGPPSTKTLRGWSGRICFFGLLSPTLCSTPARLMAPNCGSHWPTIGWPSTTYR